MRFLFNICLLCMYAAGAFAQEASWRVKLDSIVPLYGHRNWIVIADSAYPAQNRDGIETIVTGANHVQVLHEVLARLDASKHIVPTIWTDEELKFVPDADAPGVTAWRDRLASYLHNRPVKSMKHEQVISELDNAGRTFKVLILKTNMALPYTSVFLQLDCAYWSPEAEQRLRRDMATGRLAK